MLKIVISLISGMVFSLGLVLSGMTNPSKVIGFLDIFGEWDYSLALVMIAAIGVNLIFYKRILNKDPVLDECHYLPTKTIVDKKLVVGSLLFGVGWGVSGICPGPALVNLVFFNMTSIAFVISMVAGIYVFRKTEKMW